MPNNNDKDEYKIKEIIGKRRINNDIQYKVKWISSDNTCEKVSWESMLSLRLAYNLINKFEDENKNSMENISECNSNKKKEHDSSSEVSQPPTVKKIKKNLEDGEYIQLEENEGEDVVRKKKLGRKPREIVEWEKKLSQNSQNSQNLNKRVRRKREEIIKEANKFEEGVRSKLKDARGHFLFGDVANKILCCNKVNDQAFVVVEWMPRKNGIIPEKTSLSTLDLKKFDMELLVDYYESRLTFSNNGNNSLVEKEKKKDNNVPNSKIQQTKILNQTPGKKISFCEENNNKSNKNENYKKEEENLEKVDKENLIFEEKKHKEIEGKNNELISECEGIFDNEI